MLPDFFLTPIEERNDPGSPFPRTAFLVVENSNTVELLDLIQT